MPQQVRQIRPQLEPMSSAALEVLHILERVVGRIIGVAVLKHACTKLGVDIEGLSYPQVQLLLPSIASSLQLYDKSTELVEDIGRLAIQYAAQGEAS